MTSTELINSRMEGYNHSAFKRFFLNKVCTNTLSIYFINLKNQLTFCNSFSISVARITRGPRTAYSNFTRLGFKFSGVMTLEAMVRCRRVTPLELRDTDTSSSAVAHTDRTVLPLQTRLAPLIIFTGDILLLQSMPLLSTRHARRNAHHATLHSL